MKRSICGRRRSIFICAAPPVAGLSLASLPPPRSFFSSAIGPLAGLLMSKWPSRVRRVTSMAEAMQTIASQLVTAGLQRRQDRQEVVFQEQHAGDHDVGGFDAGNAAGGGGLVAGVLRRGMQAELQAGEVAAQRRAGPLDRAGQVRVHRDDDQAQRWRRRAWLQRLKWALASYRVSTVMVARPRSCA
jgi:hypothetical protein